MPTLPNMGLITPTLSGDRGTWDDKLNAALGLIDPHNHTAGKGVQVPSAGINVDADLTFGGFAATHVGQVAFAEVAVLAAGAEILFVNSSDHELYWRSNAGANVKLTSGASINTTLVGGIVGDYTASAAEVAFDDANDRYTFKQNSATGWAVMASGALHIYETGTSESVFVALLAPAALAASYNITFPLAAPASTRMLQMASTGVISAPDDYTTTGTITAGALKFTTQIERTIPVSQFLLLSANHTRHAATSGGQDYWILAAAGDVLQIPIPMNTGEQLMGYKLYLNKSTSAATTITVKMCELNGVTGNEVIVDTSTNNQNNPTFTSIEKTSGLLSTAAKGQSYYAVVSVAGGASDHVYHLAVYITKS